MFFVISTGEILSENDKDMFFLPLLGLLNQAAAAE
jgi:hypothetical protein